ncbi:MAG: protein arginine kinase [Elusimicrobia bacterium]|nr:protein arginine kinase [Elusimicrobiota bacterium]
MMFQLSNLLKSPIGWLKAEGEFSDQVVSCRVRLARNLKEPPYPTSALPRELKLVLEQVFHAAKKTKELGHAAYLKFSDMEKLDQQFLVERHLISADMLENPAHAGVIVGDKELAGVMVNEEDHLRLQYLLPGLSLNKALQSALALEGALGRDLTWAFHDEFGFLTSCPTNVGTALRASCLVHLPGLVNTQAITPLFQELSKIGFVARGFYGEGSKAYGQLYQISNATSIGKSEQELTETMSSVLKNVLRHEMQMRLKLMKGAGKAKIFDRIWRAYGVMRYTRLISYEETMEELSWIRMGLALKIALDHLNLDKINHLIIVAQPAHIQMAAGRELNPQERDELRANLVRQTLD